jgi:ABC-2 type transport system ATP-binding protein
MQAATKAAELWPVTGRKSSGPLPGGANLAVCIRGLTRHYRHPWTGRVTRGLEALDLDVDRGQVLGILGPNGAGKSTALKLLTGLLKPSSGQAWIHGVPFDEPRSRRPIGFLPEQPYFYDYLTGHEYLELAGGLSGLSGIDAHVRAREWLSRVGLGDRRNLVLRKYSKGMLQRLGLAAALVHGPAILILDEPMSGLDPYGRRDVRELILEQHAAGVTVLFSSHILPDVEALASRVAILHQGRLARMVESRELSGGAARRTILRCEGAPIVEIPPAFGGRVARRPGEGTTEFEVSGGLELNPVLDWLLRSGVKVRAVTPEGTGLEEMFLAATGGDASGPDGESPQDRRGPGGPSGPAPDGGESRRRDPDRPWRENGARALGAERRAA